MATSSRPRTRTQPGLRPRARWSLLPRGRNRKLRRAPGRFPAVAEEVAARPPAARFAALKRVAAVVGVVLASAAVGAAGFGLHHLLVHSPHFVVKAVRISPTRHVSEAQLVARAALPEGANLFSLDVDALGRRVAADPWLASARPRRELPSTVAVDVEEREAACTIALGALYLADDRGVVFKRASVDEAASFPVITGIARDAYVHDREASLALIHGGLAALALWQEGSRPAIGEIHVDPASGVTLYTRKDGIAARLGRGDRAVLAARLRRLDAAWAALGEGERPSVFFVDQQTKGDRVTVRLAQANPAQR